MENQRKPFSIAIGLIIGIGLLSVFAWFIVRNDIGGEKKIDQIIHDHDGEDEYMGLGGRMTAEEMLDYMILKYTSGLGDEGWDKDPNPDPNPNPKPEPNPAPEPDPAPKPDPGTDPSGPDHPVEEGWKSVLQEGVDNIDLEINLEIPADVTEDQVMNAVFHEAKYHTAEHGIFLERVWYNHSGQNWRITPQYPYDQSKIQEFKDKTAHRENEIYPDIKMRENTSDYRKISMINDYVCDLVTYPEKEPYSDESHTAYGALFEKSAVCDGYSRLVKMLCDDAGLDSYIVVGYVHGSGHAWNLVKVDEKWYHVDVTWNDGGATREDYLLIPDSFLEEHRTWDRDFYPEVSSTPYIR